MERVNDIAGLVPQRPPFLMVGELLFADEASARTSFTILADNILVDGHLFSEAGLLENMAQTAAAGAGFRAGIAGRPVEKGFIGAVKNLEIHGMPRVGDTLTTTTRIIETVFNMIIVEGMIHAGDVLIARCEMNIFVGPQS